LKTNKTFFNYFAFLFVNDINGLARARDAVSLCETPF